ncbi:MAG: hypothetical protein JKY20_04025 [Alphaproteobacteria bacterium]|nr:hypothetical protein [Alphaproteobacteria bacterium]
MGGFLSAPSPTPPPPPPPLPEAVADDPQKTREDQLRRRRRGRAGTVVTSQRGVLRARDDVNARLKRKTLLGE